MNEHTDSPSFPKKNWQAPRILKVHRLENITTPTKHNQSDTQQSPESPTSDVDRIFARILNDYLDQLDHSPKHGLLKKRKQNRRRPQFARSL